MDYPKMYKIRQRFPVSKIENIVQEINDQFDLINLKTKIKPGGSYAVTAGSRGIQNLALIIKTVCDYVKDCGGVPFIVPSMGSHGGATGRGQQELLSHFGITQQTMGAEIRSSMEVVQLGKTSNGAPVYMDKNAYGSDGILVVNRIKPHTDFSGKNESGIVKMVAVGLGKEKGATAMHYFDLQTTIPLAYEVARAAAPILAGLAIVENSKDETSVLKAVEPKDFLQQDAALLKKAYENVPRLPLNDADVLIVKEMGKEFSGTGMDTKVIGRIYIDGIAEPVSPVIKRIAVLNLSDHSNGNALGVGLADITTQNLISKVDYDATFANLFPTTYLKRGKTPTFTDTDKEAFELALKTAGNILPSCAKVIIIENTLHLQEMIVSQAVTELLDKNTTEILHEVEEPYFDEEGKLRI
jgi:hypothetical protein